LKKRKPSGRRLRRKSVVEYVEVVDDNDRLLSIVEREESDRKALCHRVIRVIINNSKGEWLVQQRSMKKDILPGMWDFGVAETVQYGETYLDAAMRGVREELDAAIGMDDMEPLFKQPYKSREFKRMIMVYKTIYDGKIGIDKREIEEAKFVAEKDMKSMMDKGMFTQPSLIIYGRYNESKQSPRTR
jgi:isopentenyldiphosphate isomerase